MRESLVRWFVPILFAAALGVLLVEVAGAPGWAGTMLTILSVFLFRLGEKQ